MYQITGMATIDTRSRSGLRISKTCQPTYISTNDENLRYHVMHHCDVWEVISYFIPHFTADLLVIWWHINSSTYTLPGKTFVMTSRNYLTATCTLWWMLPDLRYFCSVIFCFYGFDVVLWKVRVLRAPYSIGLVPFSTVDKLLVSGRAVHLWNVIQTTALGGLHANQALICRGLNLKAYY